MPHYTIETTYRLPVYRRRTYRAATVAEACRKAVDDDGWEDAKEDVETSGETYVSSIWQRANAADTGEEAPVPSHFGETIQRQAEHFTELVALLEEIAPAAPMTLSRHDFESWLPRARAAIAKARAILEGRRDPDDPVR